MGRQELGKVSERARVNSETTVTSKSPALLFLGIFVVGLVCVVGLWVISQRLLAPTNIDTAEIFAVAPEPPLKTLYGARTDLGIVAEFFEPTTRHKFGVARATPIGGAPLTVDRLLPAIIAYQKDRTASAELPPLLLKYLGAQIDGRRAYNIEEVELTTQHGIRRAVRFVTNRGANHALTLHESPLGTTLVLALRKETPVDPAILTTFLNSLR